MALTFEDEVKEKSRRFRRNVFDFQSWEYHRSNTRYARHFATMFSSRVIWGLARPLLYMALVSIAVVVYETLKASGILPYTLPSIQLNSKEPFGLTSFALSLLLVFRTNASYARWDEARKMWGLVLNRSRDLVRQGLTYIDPDKPELREMLCRWTPAFSRALLCHLRKDADIKQQLHGILLPEEIEGVAKATHKPNYVLQMISKIINTAKTGTAATMRMDDNITAFEDCLGGCERILKTPIPLSYTRHTSRFLIIWLTLLPFTLFSSCGLATIPMCVIISFLLLGIEEIGVSIEEPFSILALEAICDSSLNNTRELQAVHGLTGTLPGYGAAAAAAAAAAVPTPISSNGVGHANGVAHSPVPIPVLAASPVVSPVVSPVRSRSSSPEPQASKAATAARPKTPATPPARRPAFMARKVPLNFPQLSPRLSSDMQLLGVWPATAGSGVFGSNLGSSMADSLKLGGSGANSSGNGDRWIYGASNGARETPSLGFAAPSPTYMMLQFHN